MCSVEVVPWKQWPLLGSVMWTERRCYVHRGQAVVARFELRCNGIGYGMRGDVSLQPGWNEQASRD